jgi:hypothetical protein
MPPNGKIIELQALIQRHLSAPIVRHDQSFATGITQLDAVLDGGLQKGTIIELVSRRLSTGGTSWLHAILRNAANQGRWSALIDGTDSFDPQTAGATVLSSLLWIRCRKVEEAVRSADLLLRDGNLPLIFLDLRGNHPAELRKVPDTTWFRLQRAIEPTFATLIALTPCPLISPAHVRLGIEARFDLSALAREPEENLRATRLQLLRKRSHANVDESLRCAEAEAEAV